MADDQSSIIPSVVDGLNSVQRTVLLCALKNPDFQKVKEFSGYVSEHCAYRYGKQNILNTMTGMAQNYVGSNNINLLHPSGAGSRYMCTRLSSVTRHLFHDTDEPLLKYLNEDGKSIEPLNWFMPIIPMVLVNGSEGGIGTKYNPRHIIANIRNLLHGRDLVPMTPWYKWFKGFIQGETETSYTTFGNVEESKQVPNRLFITELPIGKCAEEYEEFLKAAAFSGNDKEPFIQEYTRYRHSDGTITFQVDMSPDQMNKARDEGFKNKFKLTTTLDTSNMCLLDANSVIKIYDTPAKILKEFYDLRLEYYEKRKSDLLDVVGKALMQLEDYVSIFDDALIFLDDDKKDEVLFAELKKIGYFLPSMESSTCIVEYENQEQRAEWFEKMTDLDSKLRCTSPKQLWLKDLRALEGRLRIEQDEEDEAERRMKWRPVRIEEEEPSEVQYEEEAEMRKRKRTT